MGAFLRRRKKETPVSSRSERIRTEVSIELFDGKEKCYEGKTRDISITGCAAFIKSFSKRSLGEVVGYSILTVEELRQVLETKDLSMTLDVGRKVGPFRVSVARVEKSWQKDYDMFAAFEFETASPEDIAAIEDFLSGKTEPEIADAEAPSETLSRSIAGETDVFNIILPARFFVIGPIRQMCENIVRQNGFSPQETMQITVAFDEILQNAFKHGCRNYPEDKINVQISFDSSGVFVYVRDPGGRVFDHKKYREFDKANPQSSRSGLNLVDRFTDSWAVNTKPGKYTEVSFFKNRPQVSPKDSPVKDIAGSG